MQLHVQACALPKAGNRPEEYEDAWATDLAMGRLAVADGASDSFESRIWAHALAEAFVRAPPPTDGVLAWLAEPAQVWREHIHWDQLTWYAAEKARRGAFATLLGLTIDAGADAAVTWHALALGDACLLHVCGAALLTAFPLTASADFGNAPPLLATRPEYSRRSLEELQTARGTLATGDLLLLATDAMAAWLLHEIEADRHPWAALVGLDEAGFAALVDRLRAEGALRNDDVTLLIVGVEEA